MLVDLARNDLGRVCVPGTVEVPDFMRVEHYSHVMHLVSTVAGERRARSTTRSTSSTPRSPPAPSRGRPSRGRWRSSSRWSRRGGRCTRARSATSTPAATWTWRSRSAPRCCTRGAAYVQAGAGIVADSDAATEEAETRHKARAVLSAIATAEGLREIR